MLTSEIGERKTTTNLQSTEKAAGTGIFLCFRSAHITCNIYLFTFIPLTVHV